MSFSERGASAISNGPPGQGKKPPCSVATMAIESVSSITYVPWSLETQ